MSRTKYLWLVLVGRWKHLFGERCMFCGGKILYDEPEEIDPYLKMRRRRCERCSFWSWHPASYPTLWRPKHLGR